MPVRKYRVDVYFVDGGWASNIQVRATTPWEAMERTADSLSLSALKVIESMEVKEVKDVP